MLLFTSIFSSISINICLISKEYHSWYSFNIDIIFWKIMKPNDIYLLPTFAVHNTPPEIIHTHSREAEHQGATHGLLEWPSKRMSKGENKVLSQLSRSFSKLYQIIKSNYLKLLFSIRLTATCTNLHCYSPFLGIKTKCLFWDYLDTRFLTPSSCGGMHYCRATCHTSVSLLFISHSNYATPTKT